jgi:hypothetical protein
MDAGFQTGAAGDIGDAPLVGGLGGAAPAVVNSVRSSDNSGPTLGCYFIVAGRATPGIPGLMNQEHHLRRVGDAGCRARGFPLVVQKHHYRP